MDEEVYIRMAEMEMDGWWFKGRRSIFRRIIQTLRLGNNSKILEVGCGTGGNFEMLSEFGEVSGFDMDEYAINCAKAKGPFHVNKGKLPQGCPFDGTFDLLVAFDVFEHIESDVESLNELAKKHMKIGSHILIAVPAFQFLWSEHDVSHHHKRRYSMKQLKALVESAGLEITYASYFNVLLFIPIVLVRLIKKLFRVRQSDDSIHIPRFLNKLLYFLFSIERVVIPKLGFPFGVTASVLAKKVS